MCFKPKLGHRMSILCFGHIRLLNISIALCSIKSQILGYRYQSIDGDHLWWIDSKEIYRFHHNTAPYTLNSISRHSDTTRSTRDVIHVRFAIVERISLFIHTLIRKQSIARCMRIINLKIRISFENQEIDGHINKTFLLGKSQRFCERFFFTRLKHNRFGTIACILVECWFLRRIYLVLSSDTADSR